MLGGELRVGQKRPGGSKFIAVVGFHPLSPYYQRVIVKHNILLGSGLLNLPQRLGIARRACSSLACLTLVSQYASRSEAF